MKHLRQVRPKPQEPIHIRQPLPSEAWGLLWIVVPVFWAFIGYGVYLWVHA